MRAWVRAMNRPVVSSKGMVIVLNDQWRVRDDGVQWILEVRKGRKRARASGYVGRLFHVSRTALSASVGKLCGNVSRLGLSEILALPERHPAPQVILGLGGNKQ